MRYLDILMFVFCINVSLWLMTSLGIHAAFGGAHEMGMPEQEWVESFNKTATESSLKWSNPNILDFFLTAGVTALNGMVTLFQIFASIVLLQPTLVTLGVPDVTATIISFPVYFVYMWGIVQFLVNRSGKNIE